MEKKHKCSRAGRTAKGHIKKGYRLTKGGKVVKSSKKRR